MKKTLLQIVRAILSEMDSDDVNSIQDTTEALQVADIVRGCFEEMMANRNWPGQRKLTQIDHSGDPNKPTHLKLPEGCRELVFFRYDKTKDPGNVVLLQDVVYKYPDEFLRMTSARNQGTPNTQVVTDYGGTQLVVITNSPPTYWTSFDDTYIVCDSYDSAIETALQKPKTQALLYSVSPWVHEDDAVPDLPEDAFPALIEESKSTAFFVLKQMANEKAEQKATRQRRWLSRKAWKAHGGIRYERYGRVSKK